VSVDKTLEEKELERFLDPSYDFEQAIALPTTPTVNSPTRVEAAVKTLGKLESEVIAALFPPNGEPPATLEDISEELGMTVAEVQNIADEALRGLRGLRSGPQRISKAWN
jgi:DNA-directed RNA polymerase sigma subunit (sigma70/sigma32)